MMLFFCCPWFPGCSRQVWQPLAANPGTSEGDAEHECGPGAAQKHRGSQTQAIPVLGDTTGAKTR